VYEQNISLLWTTRVVPQETLEHTPPCSHGCSLRVCRDHTLMLLLRACVQRVLYIACMLSDDVALGCCCCDAAETQLYTYSCLYPMLAAGELSRTHAGWCVGSNPVNRRDVCRSVLFDVFARQAPSP
jgi:hypothetical protein